MATLKTIFIILEVLLLFNLLIAVHELGHFLAAKWRGLKIDRFAIWFGKPIWKKRINGVEYALGWAPFGGYVALPQMATMETIEGKTESSDKPLPPISALDKIIVAFAGPLFSFLLALVFAVVVMVVGRPVSEGEMSTVVGYVEKGSPAEMVGLKPGDQILEVDNKPVSKFGGMGDSVKWRIVRSEGDTIQVKVKRGDQVLEFHPTPVKDKTKPWQRKALRQIKIEAAQSVIVDEVITNSPAMAGGLKPGDRVTALNGEPIYHFAAIAQYIEANPEKPFDLTVQRTLQQSNVQTLQLTLQAEKPISPPDDKHRIGVIWDGDGISKLAYPGAIEQVVASVNAMIDTFGALFAKRSDITVQQLGGAVKIMDVYYRLFSAEDGWRLALWFSVLMNVNLAVLNMLPVPVLDGGHITLAVLEGIRRKPISARIVGGIQTACAVLLILFMVYIAFYDVQDLPLKRNREKPVELKFAPKEPARN